MNTFCCEIINSLGSVDQMISVDTEEPPPAICAQTGDCTLKSFFSFLSIQELVTFSCNEALAFIFFFQSFANTKICIINTYFERWGTHGLSVLP